MILKIRLNDIKNKVNRNKNDQKVFNKGNKQDKGIKKYIDKD